MNFAFKVCSFFKSFMIQEFINRDKRCRMTEFFLKKFNIHCLLFKPLKLQSFTQ